jgi:hypothetical protein
MFTILNLSTNLEIKKESNTIPKLVLIISVLAIVISIYYTIANTLFQELFPAVRCIFPRLKKADKRMPLPSGLGHPSSNST